MGHQRATCPYCGKLSMKMYNAETERKREQIKCPECHKTYSVVYGGGSVKTEKTR